MSDRVQRAPRTDYVPTLRYRCDDPEHRACTGCQPDYRAMLAEAERRLIAVADVCKQVEHQATLWADPLPVPAWVERVRSAALEPSADDSEETP